MYDDDLNYAIKKKFQTDQRREWGITAFSIVKVCIDFYDSFQVCVDRQCDYIIILPNFNTLSLGKPDFPYRVRVMLSSSF